VLVRAPLIITLMKKQHIFLVYIAVAILFPLNSFSQKGSDPKEIITPVKLESYLSFLSSPLLKGRLNGSEELELASQYIASQAKAIGLKPANGNSFFQTYQIIKKTIDHSKSNSKLILSTGDTISIEKQVYSIIPTGPSDFTVEGEVVFAGYGIQSQKDKYNDLDSIKTEGKILLVMERAPMTEDGKNCQFDDQRWNSNMSIQLKLTSLLSSKPKAILIVPDPKSGFNSIEESYPALSGYLNSTVNLKGEVSNSENMIMAAMPKVLFIHRNLADAILRGTGKSLPELQQIIDQTLKPRSFAITGKTIKLTQKALIEEKTLSNVAGYIEGRDPVLKNEVVVFSGHYDHIGVTGNKVNQGADDDASGCSSLLNIAEAFQSMKKKPLRSILFLWVSGEEIGLYGSKTYVDHPLFPLNNTVADLNMDMIGRVKGIADTTSETPMTGPTSIFVISDNQSKELNNIASECGKRSNLIMDYSLSGRDHPLQLFSRSDHYNFVKKDIPILFFSSGIHTDYHTPGDVIEKINFQKMVIVTRTMFDIGLTVANKKTRIVVNNPFSSWSK
jgi:hypothetical protein